ncbi:17542_t:CDS:2, partial [Cetraspora pellucida]
ILQKAIRTITKHKIKHKINLLARIVSEKAQAKKAKTNTKEQKLSSPELKFSANNPYIDNSAEWAQIERPSENSDNLQLQASDESIALDTLSQTYDKIETPITDMNIESSNNDQMSNSLNNSTEDLTFNSTMTNTTSELENAKFTLVTFRNKRNKEKKRPRQNN